MPALNDNDLCALLRDDAPHGDLTTDTLGIGRQAARLEFRARQAMMVCASEEAVRLFELAGARARLSIRSGNKAHEDEVILEAEASAASLHRAWKTAQTLVEWAGGIATATAAIVVAANGIPVACTRKNVPGTKKLSVKAVRAGGGIMHRLGLSETLLIFPEHRLFLDETPAHTIERVRRSQPEKKLVVEVTCVDEALVWARAGADVVQLEKFSPSNVATCRRLVSAEYPRVLLAAAGGIRAENATAYAAAGADMLVTSAPYTEPPKDVQVTFRVTT
jgi:molybdenum transport protein